MIWLRCDTGKGKRDGKQYSESFCQQSFYSETLVHLSRCGGRDGWLNQACLPKWLCGYSTRSKMFHNYFLSAYSHPWSALSVWQYKSVKKLFFLRKHSGPISVYFRQMMKCCSHFYFFLQTFFYIYIAGHTGWAAKLQDFIDQKEKGFRMKRNLSSAMALTRKVQDAQSW